MRASVGSDGGGPCGSRTHCGVSDREPEWGAHAGRSSLARPPSGLVEGARRPWPGLALALARINWDPACGNHRDLLLRPRWDLARPIADCGRIHPNQRIRIAAATTPDDRRCHGGYRRCCLTVALRSVSVVGSADAADFRSPFIDAGLADSFSWIIGITTYRGQDGAERLPSSSIVPMLLLLALAVAGISLTLLVRRFWPITVGVVSSIALAWWWFGPQNQVAYTHRRFIESAAVLIVALIAVGWAALPPIYAKAGGQSGETPRILGHRLTGAANRRSGARIREEGQVAQLKA